MHIDSSGFSEFNSSQQAIIKIYQNLSLIENYYLIMSLNSPVRFVFIIGYHDDNKVTLKSYLVHVFNTK